MIDQLDILPHCSKCNRQVPYSLNYETCTSGVKELVMCSLCGNICDSQPVGDRHTGDDK